MPNLIIKLNDNPSPNNCPICGQETNPNIGAELFLAETENVVCEDCGAKHAPVLAALFAFADFSRLFEESGESIGKRMETYFQLSKMFCAAENKFGAKWEAQHQVRKCSMNGYQSFGVQKSGGKNA